MRFCNRKTSAVSLRDKNSSTIRANFIRGTARVANVRTELMDGGNVGDGAAVLVTRGCEPPRFRTFAVKFFKSLLKDRESLGV